MRRAMAAMAKQWRVGVLAGGMNEERNLSLEGGQEVFGVLSRAFPGSVELIDWTRGVDLPARLRGLDVCFNCLHGTKGEDGTIAGMLEVMEIPYTFSGVFGSACGSDKAKSKELLQHKGDVAVVPGCSLRVAEIDPQAGCPITLPVMVKDPAQGSSKGVWLCKTDEEYATAIPQVTAPEALVEKFVPGVDIVVCMLQEADGLTVWPVMEFETELEWQDNASKNALWGWEGGGGKPLVVKNCPTKRLDKAVEAKAVAMAKAVYRHFRARSALNVEFRVSGTEIYFIEASVIPALTSTSVHATCAKAAGVSYPDLVRRMLSTASLDNPPKEVGQAQQQPSELARSPAHASKL